MGRRKYTEEFKREAVELSFNSDKSCKVIAEELGINYNLLIRWRKEYKEKGDLAFPGHGKQKLTPEQEEIQRLKKELRETQIERDILKKQWPSSQRNRNDIWFHPGTQRGLIFHSDRGSQYASYEFQKILWKHGIRSSMSRKGDCWDNAVVESFFSTIKTELIFHKKYQTRKQARRDIFEYIEIFYNRIRLHSSLDYKSPEEYENERNIFKLCV